MRRALLDNPVPASEWAKIWVPSTWLREMVVYFFFLPIIPWTAQPAKKKGRGWAGDKLHLARGSDCMIWTWTRAYLHQTTT